MKKVKWIVYMLLWTSLLVSCASREQETVGENGESTEEIAAIESKPELMMDANPIFIAEGIRRVELQVEDQIILDVNYDQREYQESYEYWQILEPYGKFAIVDTEHLLTFFEKIEAINLESSDTDDEWKTRIKDQNIVLEVDYCQASQEERKMALKGENSAADSQSYRALADRTTSYHFYESEEGFYYVTLNGDEEKVYRTSTKSVEDILAVNPYDLILKLVTAVPAATIDCLEITCEGENHTILPTDEIFKTLYSEVIGIAVSGEASAEKLTHKEILSYEICRDDPELEGIKVAFHEYDDLSASVLINGVEKLLVQRADLEILKESVGAKE